MKQYLATLYSPFVLTALYLLLLTSCYSQWEEQQKHSTPYTIASVCSLDKPIQGYVCPNSMLPGIGVIYGCCDAATNKCGADANAVGAGCILFESQNYQSMYPVKHPPVYCDGTVVPGYEAECKSASSGTQQSSDTDAASEAGPSTANQGAGADASGNRT